MTNLTCSNFVGEKQVFEKTLILPLHWKFLWDQGFWCCETYPTLKQRYMRQNNLKHSAIFKPYLDLTYIMNLPHEIIKSIIKYSVLTIAFFKKNMNKHKKF